MLTVGSLFAGTGMMELGLERTGGFQTAWQVEMNVAARKILAQRWPDVQRFGDIRECHAELPAVDVVCGGDPCPKHSRARSNGESKSPDLAGYFLAMVGRLRPRWVVRENVPAPTVAHFDACLVALGYGTAVVRVDGAALTGQSRQRDIVVGGHQRTRDDLRRAFQECQDGPGPYTTRLGAGQVAPALTTHRTRYDSRDCYVWEPGRGLRILDGDERERLAGMPPGWTAEFSERTRARLTGNSLISQWAEWIGRRILSAVQP
jgi:hypothetical protein